MLRTLFGDVLLTGTCKASLSFSVTFWIIPIAISYARRISYNRVLKEMCDLWPLLWGLLLYHFFFFQHVQTGLALSKKAPGFSGSSKSVRDPWGHFVNAITSF